MMHHRLVAGALALALFAAPVHAATTTAPAKKKTATKPAAPVAIATVLGKPVTKADLGPAPPVIKQMAAGDAAKEKSFKDAWEGQALTGLVLGTLLDRYVEQKKIAASPGEISQMMVLAMKQAESPEAVKEGATKPDTASADFRRAGAAVVERFKMHEALFDQFGGRVTIDPQAGPMPFDAYKSFLEAEQKAGSFSVTPAYTERFWAAWRDDSRREFVPAADAAKVIHTAWWLEDTTK